MTPTVSPTRPLPDGDPDSTDTSMGALWRSDEPHGEGLVRFNNYEDYDDYEVETYSLDADGEVRSSFQYWDDDEIEAFISNPNNAFLSGHNLPGGGRYGVFVDGERPNCPVCGAFMSPGTPDYHAPPGRLPALGFTCAKYDRTNGEHEGYMTQQAAIDAGYYIPVGAYLRRRYGEE